MSMASKPSFGDRIADFLLQLNLPIALPADFEVMNPYHDPEVQRVVRSFARAYYSGSAPRCAVWGINPGRFGAGITGLSFTDPYALTHQAGITSTLTGRRELSAEFVWTVVEAFGGPEAFFSKIYLSALSPLGFLRHQKNINFYDDPAFTRALTPTIVQWMQKQIDAGLRTDCCVVLGTGKLRTVMEQSLRPSLPFTEVIYLEHPRFIMQYRRSQMSAYVDRYVETLLRITRSMP